MARTGTKRDGGKERRKERRWGQSLSRKKKKDDLDFAGPITERRREELQLHLSTLPANRRKGGRGDVLVEKDIAPAASPRNFQEKNPVG